MIRISRRVMKFFWSSFLSFIKGFKLEMKSVPRLEGLYLVRRELAYRKKDRLEKDLFHLMSICDRGTNFEAWIEVPYVPVKRISFRVD